LFAQSRLESRFFSLASAATTCGTSAGAKKWVLFQLDASISLVDVQSPTAVPPRPSRLQRQWHTMLVLEVPTSDTSSVLPVIGLCAGSTGVHLKRALIAFWCRRLGVLIERLESAWWSLNSWRSEDE
jgi:hypothetical protein